MSPYELALLMAAEDNKLLEIDRYQHKLENMRDFMYPKHDIKKHGRDFFRRKKLWLSPFYPIFRLTKEFVLYNNHC